MNAENKIQTLLEPDYLFWIRKGKWNLKESVLLLLGLEPRKFSEESGLLEEIKRLSEREPAYFTGVIDKTLEYEELLLNGPFSMLNLKRDRKLSFWGRVEQEAYFSDYTVEGKRVLDWAIQMKLEIPERLAVEALKFKILERDHFLNVEWDYYLNLMTWPEEIAVVLMRGLSFDPKAVNLGLKHDDLQEFQKFSEILRNHLNHGGLKSHQKMDETGICSVGYEIPVQDFLLWAQEKEFLVPKRLRKAAQRLIITKDIGSGFDPEKLTAQGQVSTNPKQSVLDKNAVQTVARCLWNQNPEMTIADIIKHQWVQSFANGTLYKGKNTLRDWIREVDARPPDKKNGRPKKVSENIPSD